MTLEFSAVRASVAQAVKQAEQARQLRIESIDRSQRCGQSEAGVALHTVPAFTPSCVPECVDDATTTKRVGHA